MSAEISNNQSLSQLNIRIKGVLNSEFDGLQWVVAEISDMNVNRSGHCYIELIEKDNNSGKIIAKARATIWAFAYRMIKPYFETTTGEALRPGIKVLLNVAVEFHEIYGFSLNVHDIDPQYTIGDLARKKKEIREQLIKEGVYEMNKDIPLARVPQNIAVISSETAAGYGDFVNQVENNPYGFDFNLQLFSAVMQGEKTGSSIIEALNRIFDSIEEYDAIVIIRGGGAKSELSSFDDYELAFFITQSPLPVLTGIGHERDDTIVDEVAHTRLKTPTAVAEFLITSLLEFSEYLEVLQTNITTAAIDNIDAKTQNLSQCWEKLNLKIRDRMEDETLFLSESKQKVHLLVSSYLSEKKNKLDRNADKLSYSVDNYLSKNHNALDSYSKQFRPNIERMFTKKEQFLSLSESKVKLLDPQNVLNRGYAYVTSAKGLVTDENQLSKGDRIKVRLAKGNIDADVV